MSNQLNRKIHDLTEEHERTSKLVSTLRCALMDAEYMNVTVIDKLKKYKTMRQAIRENEELRRDSQLNKSLGCQGPTGSSA